MPRRYSVWMALALLLALVPRPARAAGPEIVSVRKIWDHGAHNAFTDLIRWHGRWYCTFREADAHVGGDGKLRVLTSTDGQTWESAALITEDGIDLRDPKLSITPDDRLMIVGGGSVYGGTKTLKARQPRVTFSKDGRTWTPPARVLTEGEWLWRVTWHEGTAYGIAYEGNDRAPGAPEWPLRLYASNDGLKYRLVTQLDVPGWPNESTIRFLPDGTMVALVRREKASAPGWIGTSKAPYKEWRWTETKHQLGGPNFIRLPDGSLWAAGRTYPGGAKTAVARMSVDNYEPVLTLPSGGDTSYPGLVWHDGLLWMSYYSSHEGGKAAIYLAKIKLPLKAEEIGTRLEPFVDHFLIDRLAGSAQLQVQQPEPKEVVLTCDRPWEGNTCAYFILFQDGDTYRMYYRGSHFNEATKKAAHPEVSCYAESKDGIHWTRPELGLFTFEGSTQNNVIHEGEGAHNFTPFKDANPAASADARYKALSGVKGGKGLRAYRSTDAIHWTPIVQKPVITKGMFDSQNLAFWDGHAGLYREYHRGLRQVREIMTGTSADFLKWTEPEFIEYQGAPREHLYTNAILPYVRAPHILIGFPTRFLPSTSQTEPTFMASRDGRLFERYAEAVVPTTAPKDRDGNRCNYMAWGVLSLPGHEHEHELSVYAAEAYYTGPAVRLRRFTYRVDGFVALRAGADGGEAVTRPLRFDGSKLVLNYRVRGEGSVRVELQDADGRPLGALAAADCQPLTGDHVAATAAWSGGNLAGHAGKDVRLRFVLKDADVFSFRFE